MTTLRFSKVFLLSTATGLLLTALPLQAQMLLRLQASNYDPVTGIWAATTGFNAVQLDINFRATLVSGLTPNGSSAVRFDGVNDRFTLSTAIPAGTAYTAFAFLRPNDIAGANGGSILGGTPGSFHYRLSNERQDVLRQSQQDLGAGTATLSTTDFSSINATAGTLGGTYRLNGVADGSNVASGFTANITNIGSHGTNGEFFSGDIVEIRIYSGNLTDAERLAVEQEFTASYITPVPEPGTWALLLGGCGLLFVFRRRMFSRVS